MAQPTFISDGATPNRLSTKLEVLKKWLGELRNLGFGTSAENPARNDTKRQTEQKILKVKE